MAKFDSRSGKPVVRLGDIHAGIVIVTSGEGRLTRGIAMCNWYGLFGGSLNLNGEAGFAGARVSESKQLLDLK
jgi:hypothetical protein